MARISIIAIYWCKRATRSGIAGGIVASIWRYASEGSKYTSSSGSAGISGTKVVIIACNWSVSASCSIGGNITRVEGTHIIVVTH